MKIGKKLKSIRKSANLTQEKLAEKCVMSRSYLADLERDRYNPSIDTLQTIANALNVSVSEFFVDDDIEDSKNKAADSEGASNLSDEDKLLLEKIKTLTPEKARAILKMIETFEKEFDDKFKDK